MNLEQIQKVGTNKYLKFTDAVFFGLVPNTSSTANEMIDEEPQFDSNGRFRSSEYQRLLFVNS